MKRLLIVIALIIVGLFLLKGEPKSQTESIRNIIDELDKTVMEHLGQRMSSLSMGAQLSSHFCSDEPQP